LSFHPRLRRKHLKSIKIISAVVRTNTPNPVRRHLHPESCDKNARRSDSKRPTCVGDFMVLKQYYLGCLAHASYLLGHEATSTAIVVDPQRDIQQYLADAEKLRLVVRHVFLTHFHADFVAGHLELRDCCGATIRILQQYGITNLLELAGCSRRGMPHPSISIPPHTKDLQDEHSLIKKSHSWELIGRRAINSTTEMPPCSRKGFMNPVYSFRIRRG
jgi:hypothetical protein